MTRIQFFSLAGFMVLSLSCQTSSPMETYTDAFLQTSIASNIAFQAGGTFLVLEIVTNLFTDKMALGFCDILYSFPSHRSVFKNLLGGALVAAAARVGPWPQLVTDHIKYPLLTACAGIGVCSALGALIGYGCYKKKGPEYFKKKHNWTYRTDDEIKKLVCSAYSKMATDWARYATAFLLPAYLLYKRSSLQPA